MNIFHPFELSILYPMTRICTRIFLKLDFGLFQQKRLLTVGIKQPYNRSSKIGSTPITARLRAILMEFSSAATVRPSGTEWLVTLIILLAINVLNQMVGHILSLGILLEIVYNI